MPSVGDVRLKLCKRLPKEWEPLEPVRLVNSSLRNLQFRARVENRAESVRLGAALVV
jgi:hypothetical protein